jgi:predicted DNA-binding transcriptional regulator AlpA
MIKIEELIHLETKRIVEKFKKEYLDCKDLMQITGLGRDNVRAMMAKNNFPKINVGRRIIVSVSAFVAWQTTNEFRSIYGEENK